MSFLVNNILLIINIFLINNIFFTINTTLIVFSTCFSAQWDSFLPTWLYRPQRLLVAVIPCFTAPASYLAPRVHGDALSFCHLWFNTFFFILVFIISLAINLCSFTIILVIYFILFYLIVYCSIFFFLLRFDLFSLMDF